jgi:GH15 family glucan-1,4-alpha-glucosidase
MNVHPSVDVAAAQQNLDLAVVGNGRTVALVNPMARIVWWCFPRYDGDPVFCRLLAGDEEKGFSDVVLDGVVSSHSEYMRNTALVTTVLTDRQGNSIRITDFAPRFEQYGRTFRPPQLMRLIEPINGLPRITIRFRPTSGHGQRNMVRAFGSNHIRYTSDDLAVRLTTDAPLAYIDRESPFVLTKPVSLVFGADTPFEGDLSSTCREFCDRTRDHWHEWIRRLGISYEWQDVVIRAAITLKLSAFEETGAIVAAHTTSIPEAPGSGRTWDYRFCWLRDAYFVVRSLNRIGATRTMENYISYILTLVTGQTGELQPVYSIVSTDPLEERVVTDLKGYRGDGPVRIGNAAVAQNQHDTYGSAILAATPMFFDRRLPRMGDENLFRCLEPLGEKAFELAFVPDAGIWEYRGRKRIHTHSVAMCWAGCQRLEAIAAHLGLDDRAAYWGERAAKIHGEMLEKAWNANRGAFTAAFGSDDLDASVLLLPELGAVEASDPRFVSTVNAIERELKRDLNVMRYTSADDFGLPETAFLICRFWLVDALWAIGRKEDARNMFIDALKLRNSYGLMSEDVHPATNELWGNFPQTYSMAGIILSAIRLSKSWEDRYWRGSS